MDQRRSELRAGLDDVGPFETLRAKFARTRYTHTELEGAEVGTVFDNDGLEGRMELVHRQLAGFEGVMGLQRSEERRVGNEWVRKCRPGGSPSHSKNTQFSMTNP